MTVWCHLPTIFSRRFVLRFAMLAVLIIAFITTLFFSTASYAAPGVNQTLSFQGRLLRSNGGVVPDGHYNIQFNLYQDGSGTTAGNPGGTLRWTETYTNNGGTSGVEVRNGVFSVNLGSKTPFGTSVDWNQDTLWLSMNVAGYDPDCSDFDEAPCTPDGEMTPMKRINSVPTAINSSMIGGKTADQFLQLAQGVQTDASNNTSSIYLNKTGTGNLIQLQNTGVDAFTVDGSGSVTLGGNSDKTISVATGAADTSGGSLTIAAGDAGAGASGADGGTLTLQGGNASGSGGNAGNVVIDSGIGSGGAMGAIVIGNANASAVVIGSYTEAIGQTVVLGANDTAGSSTEIIIGSGSNAAGGNTTIRGKDTVTLESNGSTLLKLTNPTNDEIEYISDGGVHTGEGWLAIGTGASISHNTTEGFADSDSAQVNTGTQAWNGIGNNLTSNPTPNTRHKVSFYAKQISGPSLGNITAVYSANGGDTFSECEDYSTQDVSTPSWVHVECYITTDNTTVTAPQVYITQPNSVELTRVLLIDDLSFIDIDSTPQLEIGSTATNSTNTIYGKSIFKTVGDQDSSVAFQIQRADSTPMFVADSSNETITLGDPESANKTIISTATGKITKYGDARNTHSIKLTAEYGGSVLDAGSGSNNSGTMTSGVNLTDRMNYYKWTTSQATNQSYDVVVQVPIPQDFDGWASSNPLSIAGYTSDTTNGTITLEARDSTGAVRCNFVSATPGSTNTWATNNTACTLSSGTYTPGDYMTLRIRMQSPTDGDIRIGNITLDYLSKY